MATAIRLLLKREGGKLGKKLVYRLYKGDGLTLRHKPRKKVANQVGVASRRYTPSPAPRDDEVESTLYEKLRPGQSGDWTRAKVDRLLP